jgi:2-polyprenyl-6-hydroxyphenyl methylase/3-demethylubiquinone-9 3-methyltransferase
MRDATVRVTGATVVNRTVRRVLDTLGRHGQRPERARNDLRQYDDLVGEWWRPEGAFAALQWLAAARAASVPPPPRRGAVLVDLGCGGGLLAPYLAGYLHVGVDLSLTALRVARSHGAAVVRADVARLPIADETADVVVAGELFEHVSDLPAAVAEVARVLRPAGLLLFDTINATRLARVGVVTLAERLPGGPPPRIHDPDLFVPVDKLRALLEGHGVGDIELWGLRPSIPDYLAYLLNRSRPVRMQRTGWLGAVYQGVGRRR